MVPLSRQYKVHRSDCKHASALGRGSKTPPCSAYTKGFYNRARCVLKAVRRWGRLGWQDTPHYSHKTASYLYILLACQHLGGHSLHYCSVESEPLVLSIPSDTASRTGSASVSQRCRWCISHTGCSGLLAPRRTHSLDTYRETHQRKFINCQ